MDTKSHCTSLLDGMRSRLRELRAANGANVTITFALATIPIVGAVGAAIDYSHANSVKVAMQAAADSTALMLAKDAAALSSSEIQTKGNAYFKALFTRPEAKNLNININYTTESGSQVTVAATADVKTDFMQMMGFPKLKVGANSQARWGNTKLRVGLVLDNTGSMASDGKMDALKTATKALLTQLKNSAAQNGDVYVSIIPFSKDVNVGKQFTFNSNLLRLDLAAAAYGLGGLTNLQLWNLPNIHGILNSTGTAASPTATRITTPPTPCPRPRCWRACFRSSSTTIAPSNSCR